MQLLKGRKISKKILAGLKKKLKKEKLTPRLAVILVGKDKASQIYVSLKQKAAKATGISFAVYRFATGASENQLLGLISRLNREKKISGIIVQLPLPPGLHSQKIINSIDPQKDADGFHPRNLKLFLAGKKYIYPVLPKAIMSFLKPGLEKKSAVVIAKSEKFGKIMATALRQKRIKADYVLVGMLKRNLGKIKKADIVISAVGQPGLISGDLVKKGVVIIDAGITKKGKKVRGDADFASVSKKAAYLTPVPGGVGPVTIACLLENVYLAAKKSP